MLTDWAAVPAPGAGTPIDQASAVVSSTARRAGLARRIARGRPAGWASPAGWKWMADVCMIVSLSVKGGWPSASTHGHEDACVPALDQQGNPVTGSTGSLAQLRGIRDRLAVDRQDQVAA